jgi:hypothetical protein
MTTQQVVFYEDSFQIHIEKEYHDGILIEEIHYDNIGQITYDYYEGVKTRYFYHMNNTIHYIVTETNGEFKLRKHTQTINSNKNYTIDKDTYTHLCTLNSSDAISYIKKYIIKYTLQYHGL